MSTIWLAKDTIIIMRLARIFPLAIYGILLIVNLMPCHKQP